MEQEAGGNGRPTRREFLEAAGAAAAAAALGVPGCLGAARNLPANPARWPVFRFAHAGDLRLSFRNPASRPRAIEAAEAIASIPELDALLLTGELVQGPDPLDLVLLEEFLRAADTPAYAVTPSPLPAGDREARNLEKAGLAAWKTPWAESPARGIVLAGLSPGAPASGDLQDPSLAFLASAADAHPDDCLMVLLPRPARAAPALDALSPPTCASEELLFMLEAATPVKMVLSGGTPVPFSTARADLHYFGAPPLLEFPRGVRQVTVSGHGAVVETRAVCPPWVSERDAAAEKALAARFNPRDPVALGKHLAKEAESRILGLR